MIKSKIFLFSFLGFALLILAVPSPALCEQIKENVWFIFSDSQTPPDATANWKQVTLPHIWTVSETKISDNGWYRFQVNIPPNTDEHWVVFIERISMNAAVFIGQHYLGDGGSFEAPVSRNWVRPLLFKIPKTFIHAHGDVIYIRAFSSAIDLGGLEHVYVGKHSELQPKYDALFSYYILSSQAIFYMQLALCLLLFGFWLIRKKESVFLWLSAASLMGAIFPLNMFVRDIIISHHMWEWIVQTSIGWLNWFIFMFAHRYLNIKRTGLERIIIVYALAGALVLILLPTNQLMFAGTMWQGGFAILAFYVLFVSAHCWWKSRRWGHLAWLIAIFSLLMTGLIDWVSILLWQLHGINNFFVFHLGTSILILIASALLLERFLQSLKSLETVNQQLVGKIDALEAEDKRRQAVLDERQRIMRDLHDGLGNSLVSAMALSRNEDNAKSELQEVLQEAMSEMHLILGSANSLVFNFEKALVFIKERTKLTLLASNIALDWQVEAMLAVSRLHDSEAGMQLIRILQEALTNIMKHANASKVCVVATVDGGMLTLCISDNGQGMLAAKQGHGLNNMKLRAKAIHASLRIQSDTSGTSITFLLPID
ncbi:MAG TPA: hypothetical protein EYG66_03090 [Mariprofundaceae bacterium]|nr:hypothetical protein [Mariprofundaceae bacterium]